MQPRNLIIYGDSAFAERIAAYVQIEARDRVVAFTIERAYQKRERIKQWKVIPFEDLSSHYVADEVEILLGIGYSQMNDVRELVYNKCVAAGYKVGSYISTRATLYSHHVGEGCIMLPGAFIGPDCVLGKCNFIDPDVCFTHDIRVGDFNFFSANVVSGGFVEIQNHCFVGLRVTLKNNISISDYSLLGSCTNVVKSIDKPHGVWVGNPARALEGKTAYAAVV